MSHPKKKGVRARAGVGGVGEPQPRHAVVLRLGEFGRLLCHQNYPRRAPVDHSDKEVAVKWMLHTLELGKPQLTGRAPVEELWTSIWFAGSSSCRA